jgi:hypothetical protein
MSAANAAPPSAPPPEVEAQAAAVPKLDTTRVRSGITGHVYTAPVGTAGPTDTTTAWPAAWQDLGYLTDDGPAITPGYTTKDIMGWQSLLPVRKVATERTLEWKFPLMQTDAFTFPLAFGGGTITGTAPGPWTYTPPDPSFIDERAFGLEVNDGTVTERYILQRGLVTDVKDIPFKRGEAVRFEVTVSMLATAAVGTQPWTMVTNDPAFATA